MPLENLLFTARFENLDDNLDNSDKSLATLDVDTFLTELFRYSNNEISLESSLENYDFKKIELGLSGTQDQDDIIENRYHWTGVDDDTNVTRKSYAKDEGFYSIEQMRLRTFLVEFIKD